jgi:hypothetical protein
LPAQIDDVDSKIDVLRVSILPALVRVVLPS